MKTLQQIVVQVAVVFDEWDWNEPKVHKILNYLTGEIKKVTLSMRFRLPNIIH